MTIELKYYNPNTGRTSHLFFPEVEMELVADYLKDAQNCGCQILIFRLIPTSCIHVG